MSIPFALARDVPSQDENPLQPENRQMNRSPGSLQENTLRPDEADSSEALWAALREVNDPELPISIVDMGLVVALERREGTVALKLTFTAMGCPAMEMILDDVRARLLQEPGVEQVEIEVVWDPPWTPARLSEEGRDTLRMWGIGL
ncbi:MAG TPA: metal-sulfur cluster assembly factor [Ktedonobacterales bacterium]|jgi:metal-sulfur cluster biosynthetic enzyme